MSHLISSPNRSSCHFLPSDNSASISARSSRIFWASWTIVPFMSFPYILVRCTRSHCHAYRLQSLNATSQTDLTNSFRLSRLYICSTLATVCSARLFAKSRAGYITQSVLHRTSNIFSTPNRTSSASIDVRAYWGTSSIQLFQHAHSNMHVLVCGRVSCHYFIYVVVSPLCFLEMIQLSRNSLYLVARRTFSVKISPTLD